MQIICTTRQTDNHASTPSLNFYGSNALPDAQPTVSKHWKRDVRSREKLADPGSSENGMCVYYESHNEHQATDVQDKTLLVKYVLVGERASSHKAQVRNMNCMNFLI